MRVTRRGAQKSLTIKATRIAYIIIILGAVKENGTTINVSTNSLLCAAMSTEAAASSARAAPRAPTTSKKAKANARRALPDGSSPRRARATAMHAPQVPTTPTLVAQARYGAYHAQEGGTKAMPAGPSVRHSVNWVITTESSDGSLPSHARRARENGSKERPAKHRARRALRASSRRWWDKPPWNRAPIAPVAGTRVQRVSRHASPSATREHST